jgi:phage gpG-like protein
MITFSFQGDTEAQLVEFFEQSTPRVLAAIESAVNLSMADLMAYVQREKLQGQVLKSHNNGAGGLAGSINVRFERDGDVSISGYVGTNLIYARIHEYGFSGPEFVPSHYRMQTQAFGHPMTPRQVLVRDHTRQMEMPARPYMRPSLEENKQAIIRRIRTAIEEALAA